MNEAILLADFFEEAIADYIRKNNLSAVQAEAMTNRLHEMFAAEKLVGMVIEQGGGLSVGKYLSDSGNIFDCRSLYCGADEWIVDLVIEGEEDRELIATPSLPEALRVLENGL